MFTQEITICWLMLDITRTKEAIVSFIFSRRTKCVWWRRPTDHWRERYRGDLGNLSPVFLVHRKWICWSSNTWLKIFVYSVEYYIILLNWLLNNVSVLCEKNADFHERLFLFSAFWHCSPCKLHLCHHRQEQQFARPGGGAGHDWSSRVRHWRHVWLQLRLRHQPSQGSGTKNFHRHGWLGLWSIYVRFSLIVLCFLFVWLYLWKYSIWCLFHWSPSHRV